MLPMSGHESTLRSRRSHVHAEEKLDPNAEEADVRLSQEEDILEKIVWYVPTYSVFQGKKLHFKYVNNSKYVDSLFF